MLATTFTCCVIHCPDGPGEPRVETSSFDLTPALDQGRAICNLFAEFLAGAPAEFRRTLPFLNKVQIDLQWAAASGGAAFYAVFHENQTIEMGVLAAGAEAEADARILEALTETIAVPMLGVKARQWTSLASRPLAVRLRMPVHPELSAAVDLLATALASVYFRAILTLVETGAAAD